MAGCLSVPVFRFDSKPEATSLNDLYYECLLKDRSLLKYPFFKIAGLTEWLLTVDPKRIDFSRVPDFSLERTKSVVRHLKNGVCSMKKTAGLKSLSPVVKSELKRKMLEMQNQPEMSDEEVMKKLEAALSPTNMQSRAFEYAENLEVELSEYVDDLPELLRMAKLMCPIRTCCKNAGVSIGGVSNVMGYFGKAGTMSFAHLEDFDFTSVSVMYEGSAPKVWIGFCQEDTWRVRDYMNANIPHPCSSPEYHKEFVFNNDAIRAIGNSYVVIQRAGEIVFTNPGCLHQVVNTGYNYMEATNIWTKGVLPIVSRVNGCNCEHRVLWHESPDWLCIDRVFTDLEHEVHASILNLASNVHVPLQMAAPTVQTIRDQWNEASGRSKQTHQSTNDDGVMSSTRLTSTSAIPSPNIAAKSNTTTRMETVAEERGSSAEGVIISSSRDDSTEPMQTGEVCAEVPPKQQEASVDVPEVPCSAVQDVCVQSAQRNSSEVETTRLHETSGKSRSCNASVAAMTKGFENCSVNSGHATQTKLPQKRRQRGAPFQKLLKAMEQKKHRQEVDRTKNIRRINYKKGKGAGKVEKPCTAISLFFKRKLENVGRRLQKSYRKAEVPGPRNAKFAAAVRRYENIKKDILQDRALANSFVYFLNGNRSLFENRVAHGYTVKGLIADFVDYNREDARKYFVSCMKKANVDSQFIETVMASQASFDAAFEVDRKSRIPAEHDMEYIEDNQED